MGSIIHKFQHYSVNYSASNVSSRARETSVTPGRVR